MNTPVIDEIVRKINRLPDDMQHKVLTFVDALQTTNAHGSPGKALLEFAGMIPTDEIQTIADTIESGCERVESNEW